MAKPGIPLEDYIKTLDKSELYTHMVEMFNLFDMTVTDIDNIRELFVAALNRKLVGYGESVTHD